MPIFLMFFLLYNWIRLWRSFTGG